MIQFAVLFAVALGAAHAQRPEAPTGRFVPYRRLPDDVQAMVSDVIRQACAIDARSAEKMAKAVRLFRADLDDDGIADYVLDEWSGPCNREPEHYVHVWMGAGDGHYHYTQREEVELTHGPIGFAWVQMRCNPRSNLDFQIEEYRRGSMVRSKCYPAATKGEELHRRGLTSALSK